MKLIDNLRTALGIRRARQLPPPSAKPPVGASIVYETLRIRLARPISDEQWDWLSMKGWRVANMRTDRRHYSVVSEHFVSKLLEADEEKRETLQQRIDYIVREGKRDQRNFIASQ